MGFLQYPPQKERVYHRSINRNEEGEEKNNKKFLATFPKIIPEFSKTDDVYWN